MRSAVKKKRIKRKARNRNLVCEDKWIGLRERCLAPIDSFASVADRVETSQGPYFFQDNGADILAVAHLDTVQNHRHFGSVKGEGDVVYNCQLDDRLGAWLALDVFPAMGIKMDVLLTTGEELGFSTARGFAAPREYNWLAEFDRSGTDAVTYDLESDDWLVAIDGCVNVGYGFYSDIAELDGLGVCGANWGVGCYENHGPDSRFVVSELLETVRKFERFYSDWSDTRFGIDLNTSYHDYWDKNQYDPYGLPYQTKEKRVQREEWEEYLAEYSDLR